MPTRSSHEKANAGAGGSGPAWGTFHGGGLRAGPRLTGDQVWQAVARASFAILSYATPAGEPRSSGVVYKIIGGRLIVAVAPDSWKAKHIAVKNRVSVTVPVRRGGILSLVAPIPPATISFSGTAVGHPAGSRQARSLLDDLGSLIPAERRSSGSVIEILPDGAFLTYALDVPLRKMLDPAVAQARVPVTPQESTR